LPLYQDVFFEFSRDHHAPTENGGDDRHSTCSPARVAQSGIFGAAK
jgi:hypothetical protein